MGRRRSDELLSVSDSMDGMKSNYEAAKSNRFLRRRSGYLVSGSSADFHYRNVFDYLKIMEYARDMDRNDAIIGAAIDRTVLNTIKNGFTVDPQTDDPELNKDLKARFEEWAGDKRQCDIACQHTFTEFEEFALRSSLVDGDDLVLPTDGGQMQFVEGHRLRTPAGTKRNLVCGILLDDLRKPVEYWITKDDVDPWMPLPLVSDVDRIPAFDADNNPTVFHIWRGKRKSQSRGVSVLAPIFLTCGQFEDIHFAELVKRQISSCFAIIRERASDWKPGGIDPYGKVGDAPDIAAVNRRICEELAPGFEARGLPGEKISAFSPNIPGGDFFPHIRLTLQIIFLNLGLPLVMGMMDASDTNFSGWRGAVDEARRGFQRNQAWLIERFHSPVYEWKLRQFAQNDAVLRGRMNKLGRGFFAHAWNTPKWPYIQPLQDAQADKERQTGLLSSPRRIHMERGQEFLDIVGEAVADNGAAILAAGIKAKELSAALGETVSWREVLFMTSPDMLKAIVKAGQTGLEGVQAQAQAAGKGEPEKPEALNGLQITAAVDVLGKVRSGTIAAAAARELMVGMGLTPAAADKMIAATPAGAGTGDADKEFFRKLLLALGANPETMPVLLNALKLQPVVTGAGAPPNAEYDEPYLPVLAPAGSAVSGAVLKDADGSIVGGATLGGVAQPETQNTAAEQQHEDKKPDPAPTAAAAPGAEPVKTDTEGAGEAGKDPAEPKEGEPKESADG